MGWWPPPASLLADDAAQGAPAGEPLHVDAVGDQAAHALPLLVVRLGEVREPELLGDEDLLAAGELVLGLLERLDRGGELLLLRPDGDEDLADVHAGRRAVGLAEGSAHAGRESIGAGARQRLVDAEDVERVGPDADVEEVPA